MKNSDRRNVPAGNRTSNMSAEDRYVMGWYMEKVAKIGIVAGSVLFGAGLIGSCAEQLNMRDCAQVGYVGEDTNSQFATDCQESYAINHDGNPDNDNQAYKSSESGKIRNVTFTGLGLALASGYGIMRGKKMMGSDALPKI